MWRMLLAVLFFCGWSESLSRVAYRLIQKPIVVNTSKSDPGALALEFVIERQLAQRPGEAQGLGSRIDVPASAVNKFLLEGRLRGYRALQLQPQVFASSEIQKTHRLTGNLEVFGVGFGPNRFLQVHWQNRSRNVERFGTVDLERGRYHIEIPEANGSVTAQMVDGDGNVLGIIEKEISELSTTIPSNDSQSAIDLPLKILSRESGSSSRLAKYEDNIENNLKQTQAHPSSSSSTLENSKVLATTGPGSAPENIVTNSNHNLALDDTVRLGKPYPFEHPKRLAAATVVPHLLPELQHGGTVETTILGIGSTYMVAATDAAHGKEKTFQLATAGTTNAIPVFKKSTVDAMEQLVQMSGEAIANSPLVWGVAEIEGLAASGVTVTIENQPDARVFYLNEIFLPDPAAKATSSHGRFVIANLYPGHFSAVAMTNRGFFAATNFLVTDEGISHFVVSKSRRAKVVSVRTFDAFSGSPLGADIQLQTQPEKQRVRAEDQILLAGSNQMALCETQPLTPYYAPTVHIYNESTISLDLPLIRWDWISSIYEKNKGLVIGFVPQGDYTVSLENFFDRSINPSPIFFNSSGNTSNHSEQGGGFRFEKLNVGVYFLKTRHLSTGEIRSQIVDIREGEIVVYGPQNLTGH